MFKAVNYILVLFFGIFYLIIKLATLGMQRLRTGAKPAAA